MRSTMAMAVKTPRTAVGIVRTGDDVSGQVCNCSVTNIEEGLTSNAIHRWVAIPETIEQAQVYEDRGYRYDRPGNGN
jgi:hypothetical protein